MPVANNIMMKIIREKRDEDEEAVSDMDDLFLP
jgi:hypothetical protein